MLVESHWKNDRRNAIRSAGSVASAEAWPSTCGTQKDSDTAVNAFFSAAPLSSCDGEHDYSYAFCVNAMLSALLSWRNTFRNHHAVKNGVKIAVTMTDAATWTVAAAATAAYDGSAIATACGTAEEF